MGTLPKQPTLHDVARMANVSHQTVSRVINNGMNVAPKTRERVLAAVASLDYRPNRAARSLITGRSQTLQLITFNSYYFEPVRFLLYEAKDLNYQVGVSAPNRPASREEIAQLFDDLTSRMVDGFLIFDPQIHLDYDEIKKLCRGIPFVQMAGSPAEGVPGVVIDHRAGMNQLMDHLLGLGHRKIVEIPGNYNNWDARVRHETFRRKMMENSLDPDNWVEGDFTMESGYRVTRQLLASNRPLTALVCGNDDCALGALRALHERGLRVPEDVSVVGYDDLQQTGYYEPPLTTIQQDYSVLGRMCLHYLLAMIENPLETRRVVSIHPRLIVRKSTAPPAASLF